MTNYAIRNEELNVIQIVVEILETEHVLNSFWEMIA